MTVEQVQPAQQSSTVMTARIAAAPLFKPDINNVWAFFYFELALSKLVN